MELQTVSSLQVSIMPPFRPRTLKFLIIQPNTEPLWRITNRSSQTRMTIWDPPWMPWMRNWNSTRTSKWRRIRSPITYSNQRRAARSFAWPCLKPQKKSRKNKTRTSSTRRSWSTRTKASQSRYWSSLTCSPKKSRNSTMSSNASPSKRRTHIPFLLKRLIWLISRLNT